MVIKDGEQSQRRSRLKLISVQAVPPDQKQAIEALERVLLECGLTNASQRAACLNRLVALPDSLLLPRLRRLGLIGTPPRGFLDEILGNFDGLSGDDGRNTKARLLRLNEGVPDENARWADLPVPRKSALPACGIRLRNRTRPMPRLNEKAARPKSTRRSLSI
jgi:hypothetical protein